LFGRAEILVLDTTDFIETTDFEGPHQYHGFCSSVVDVGERWRLCRDCAANSGDRASRLSR
jgi:hypothetical protein